MRESDATMAREAAATAGVRSLAALVCACSVFGCSSPSTSAPAAGGDGGCGSAPVSFKSDVLPIFAASCSVSTVCHGQMHNAGEENLYLGLSAHEGTNGAGDIAAVYAALVGVASLEDPSMNLVTSNDPKKSYLWHKVNGDPNAEPTVASGCLPAANGPSACSDCIAAAPCGAPMPLSGFLEPSKRCAIENWITQGAKNN
jgi:hypothetical protein